MIVDGGVDQELTNGDGSNQKRHHIHRRYTEDEANVAESVVTGMFFITGMFFPVIVVRLICWC